MEQAWSHSSAASTSTTSATPPPPLVFKETEVRPTFMVSVPLMQCIGTPLMRGGGGAVDTEGAVDYETASPVALRAQQLNEQLSSSSSLSTAATNTPSSPSYSFSPYSPVYSSPVYSPEQQQLLHQQLQHQHEQHQRHQQQQRHHHHQQQQQQQHYQRQFQKPNKQLSCSTSSTNSSAHKEIHIIDMTHQTANRASCEFTKSPSMSVVSASSSPISSLMIESPSQEQLPATPNSGGASRRRKGAPDAKKSMVARSRPRDERGSFLPKGIAVRIEGTAHPRARSPPVSMNVLLRQCGLRTPP